MKITFFKLILIFSTFALLQILGTITTFERLTLSGTWGSSKIKNEKEFYELTFNKYSSLPVGHSE